MLITDHINLTFRSPLFGPTLPGEIRFPDMSDPYDGELRAWARAVARDLGIAMEEGVYAGVQGPSYETPAEIRFLEGAGADAVGMSTIAEVVAARARGIRCAGISIIANQAAGIIPVRLSHADVIRAASGAAEMLGRLLTGIVGRLPG
jgi:purine-nucleoside phosphorylase